MWLANQVRHRLDRNRLKGVLADQMNSIIKHSSNEFQEIATVFRGIITSYLLWLLSSQRNYGIFSV